MSNDSPKTPPPDGRSRRRRQTSGALDADALRDLLAREGAPAPTDEEIEALEAHILGSAPAVPTWGVRLGWQVGSVERSLERLGAAVEQVTRAVGETSAQVRHLSDEVRSLSEAVRGRDGLEQQMERQREEHARELARQREEHARQREEIAREGAAISSRLAALHQWQADRDRSDTVRISDTQREWWGQGLRMVGGVLVGLALGGGAVGVVTARACEAPPAAVRPP
jgi:hypothetical protein